MNLIRAPWFGVTAILCAATAACIGHIGEDDPNGNGNGNGSEPGAGSAGQLGLQRLTSTEYLNTIAQILELPTRPTVSLPTDPKNDSGFVRPGLMNQNDLSTLLDASDQILEAFQPSLVASLPCDPATGEDACAQTAIAAFTRKAYRRPPLADELTRLHRVFATQRGSSDFATAMRMVYEVILNAPSFLYHWEAAAMPLQFEGSLVKLGPYEVASRLSYYLTKGPPDAALSADADRNQLDTVDKVAAHARRLLATPNARGMIADFTTQWLGIGSLPTAPKNPAMFPDYSVAVATAMQQETQAFAASVILDGDHSWSSLMTASYSIIDGSLAPLYGVKPPSGTGAQRVELDPAQRIGILTHASVLATASDPSAENPVKRGKLVQTEILCAVLPPPPKAFLPPSAKPGEKITIRQLFEQTHASPGCNTCHDKLDPPGFAFGHYDAIGRYVATENGLPIDASGSLTLPSGATITFEDTPGFVRAIADSRDAKDCFARHWLRYALMRREGDADTATLQAVDDAFAKSKFDIQELLVAVATSQAFRYRVPAAGESP